MRKRDHLTSLALLGISAGLMMGGCQKHPTKPGRPGETPPPPGGNKASASEQMTPDMQSYYSSLSPDAQKKFMQLDAQHRMMAIEMSNQKGTGQNACKGLGGCATAQHECAGKNSCKGQGGAPISSPNKAVDIQYNHQMNQRQKTNGNMQSGSSHSSGNPSGTANH